MKILFVIANLANGGAERVLKFLSDQFCIENEVKILVLEKNFGFYEFHKNVEIIQIKPFKSSKFFSKFEKIRFLRAEFKSFNPDVVISFIDWTNILCVLANFGLNFKHIATEHHSQDYLKSSKFRLLRDIAYRKVDALTLLSKSDFDYYKFVKNRYIIHNPFYINDTKSYKKENIILSVGRLELVKGYDIYFRALSSVDKKKLANFKVIIAGDGSLLDELKSLARSLDLNIEFVGHVNDVEKYYAKAKIFILSSRSEGLSNVLIESANFACARISTNTTGAIELIENNKNGIVCKDEKELTNAINRLLDDENLIEFLSKNAKLDAEKFSAENVFTKWKDLLQKVINK